MNKVDESMNKRCVWVNPVSTEHRNMPVEEAFALLSSSFKHRQGMDSGNSDRRMQAAAGIDAHPPNIQLLINLLQENRPLSVPEYDRLIRYLNERRDRQSRLEMNEDPNRAASNMANNQHQAMAYIQGNVFQFYNFIKKNFFF